MKANDKSMIRINKSMVRGLRGGERGQGVFGFLLLFAIGFLAVGALVIDAGRLYYAYQQLVSQTQEAALAAGMALGSVPTTDTQAQAISYVKAAATTYSGQTGDLNNLTASPLTNVTITATPTCLAGSSTLILPPCTASLASDNAVTVTETATVPTTFAKLLGVNSWNISSSATASAKGGYNGPYNLAIIVDSTESMGDTDSDSQCGGTRISCALAGVQVLLNSLSPCYPGSTSGCGTATTSNVDVYSVKGLTTGTLTSYAQTGTEPAYNVTNAVDEVALFTFPGLTAVTQAQNDFACPTVNPLITPYNNGPVYQIVPFSSDYRASDTATTLNTSSDLVKAVGGAPSCGKGMGTPGGQATYYAGAIYAAQANLVANARPNTKNVIVILSDGQASASDGGTSSKGPAYLTSSVAGCTVKAPSSGDNLAGCVTGFTSTDECAAAVTAAQAAAMASGTNANNVTYGGTTIYSVAYGAEASATAQCPSLSPCETMEDMALNAGSTTPYMQNFFSDYTATKSSGTCISNARPTSNLNQIFQEISYDLTAARLIPNNTM